MLKISITLPNQAQINLETADAAVIDKILAVVLRDLDRNLAGVADKGPPLPAAPAPAPVAAETPPPAAPPSVPPQSVPPPDPAPSPVLTWETAAAEVPEKETTPSPWPAAIPDTVAAAANLSDPPTAALEPEENEDWPDFADGDEDDDEDDAAVSRLAVNGAAAAIRPGMFAPSEQAFIDFCREASPLGDMRRVVVAAEAASRYLGMSGVDAQGLGHLFNLAGWPPAHSFTQTLRNAARSKFRWLERVPGRAGYYAVTDLGRKTALGE